MTYYIINLGQLTYNGGLFLAIISIILLICYIKKGSK